MSVTIVDYGMGNLFSVKKILDTLGVSNQISNQPEDILNADRIILPGVGAFYSAMNNLHKYNLIDALNQVYKAKKPIWGICLGMQIMAQYSDEGKKIAGLGWIDATVEHLKTDNKFRLPHMGWNNIDIINTSSLFNSFLERPTFYFTHNYVIKPKNINEIAAICDYSKPFAAAILSNNLFGTQFHPEKSQLNGRILVENFLNWRL